MNPPVLHIDESHLASRVASLTLEEKVDLLQGADFVSTRTQGAVGLGRIVLSDGPAGVRGESWDEREASQNLPCPTAMAASWNEEQVARLAGIVAEDALQKGVHVVLA